MLESIWDPSNFDEAVNRLPEKNHPLYDTDETIEHLSNLKYAIYQMMMTPEIYFLEERVYQFNLDELKLLEQYSFKRDLKNATYFELDGNISPTLYTILESNIDVEPNKKSILRISTSRPPVFDFTPEEYQENLPYIVFVERSYDLLNNPDTFRTDEVYLCILVGKELMEVISQ